MRGAGGLQERVAFDPPLVAPDGSHGVETGWDTADAVNRRAEFIYQRGSEAVEAARLSGRAIYKIRIRSSAQTRAITTAWRMRDLRRKDQQDKDVEYNLREVDVITNRQWIYIIIEGGVAV